MVGTKTKYVSGNHAVATMMGGIEHESPLLPFNNNILIFKTKWRQMADLFFPLDYNTPIPPGLISGNTAYLVDEGPRTPIGLCVDWERVYARIPDMYDMPGGVYKIWFPGFGNRIAFQASVPLTIRRTFFLCGNNGAFSKWQDIPVNVALRVFDAADGTLIGCIGDQTLFLDSTTTPSDATYQNQIATNQLIQVEDSKITPWRGSIFVREDYFVTAQ